MEDYRMVLSNEDAKKVGKDLINAAQEERKQRFGKAVMERIQEMMTQRIGALNLIERTTKEMELYDRRLKAIEDGEFQVAYDGAILYNEAILNISFAEYRERK